MNDKYISIATEVIPFVLKGMHLDITDKQIETVKKRFLNNREKVLNGIKLTNGDLLEYNNINQYIMQKINKE